jgi:hypothetical protein
MNVYTEADKHVDSVREHIRDAINELDEIVIHGCWGVGDYGKEFYEELQKVFSELIDIRRRIH